jgi:hypothetical protein
LGTDISLAIRPSFSNLERGTYRRVDKVIA